jgi:hypothetical protein
VIEMIAPDRKTVAVPAKEKDMKIGTSETDT